MLGWSIYTKVYDCRYLHGCTSLPLAEGQLGVLVAGGYSHDYLNSTEIYSPTQNRWDILMNRPTQNRWDILLNRPTKNRSDTLLNRPTKNRSDTLLNRPG